MKLFSVYLLIITLTSCSSIKFKEIEMDSTQGLKGNVKEIRWKTLFYNTKFTDSVIRQQDILVVYDKKYNPLKQIVSYSNAKVEEIYNYNSKGLLETIVVKYTKSTNKTEYKYDQNNNIIEYNWYTNDTLTSSKLIKYDPKNNPIERQVINIKYPKDNWSEKIIYDYKNKSAIVKSFDNNDKERNSYSKITYDNNGFIIQLESVNKNHKTISKSTSEYDGLGNLTSSKFYDENENVKSILTTKNIYDKYGNIILREKFSNNKLFEKTEAEISYY